MVILRLLRRFPFHAVATRLVLIGLALVFIVFFPGDTPGGNSLYDRALGQSKDVLFNYAAWELDAILGKIKQVQSSVAPFLDETQRSRFVADHLNHVGDLQTLDSQIAQIFSDPKVSNPEQASAELRTKRDALKTTVAQEQPLAEAIIETQVATVLRDEGFATLGEIIPPVSAKITELPMLLVVSPRNMIRRDLSINTINLSADQRSALEGSIDKDLNVSSLIEPLGGLALYPSMVIQSWSAPYEFEVVAHEWSHHYLYFFPLGVEYLSTGGETWIINETTASLFGKEIGRKTIERYYHDYPDIMRLLPPIEPALQPTPQQTTPTPTPTRPPNQPPPFDIGAEMDITRRVVDFLLEHDQIDLAERFMEVRRRYFATKGYTYRKLNQAFFAFYGGYQSPSGGGAAGADPIGPAIAELRRNSPTIKAWMETMRGITSREALLAARDQIRP